MKKLALSLAALAALAGNASAAFKLGDATVTFMGSASATYEDNLLLSEVGKLDDTALKLAPGLEINFGREGANHTTVLTFTETLTRYLDVNGLDSNLANLSLRSTLRQGNDSYSLNASYAQSDQNTPVSGVPGRLRRNTISFGTNGEWEIRVKNRLSVGFNFEDTNYKQAGLADSAIYTIPLSYFYELRNPKQFISAGFTYRKAQLDAPGTDFTDYKYSVGFRQDAVGGNVKLTGTFNVGLNQRQPEVGGNESSLGLDANLNYAYSPKTAFSLGLSNDFGQASVGTSQKTLRVNGGVNQQFATGWSGSANASFSTTDYLGARSDDYMDGTLAVTWAVFSRPQYSVSLVGAYTYKDNNSNVAGSSYTANVFSISANVRF
jgi:hypothetical protein